MSIKQITKLRYKTKDKPPMEGVPLLGYNKRYDSSVQKQRQVLHLCEVRHRI